MILPAFLIGISTGIIFGTFYGIRWERDRKAEVKRIRELVESRNQWTSSFRLMPDGETPDWVRRATTEIME